MYCSVCVCVCGLVCVWCMYCSVCMYVCGLVCVWEYVLYTHSTHKWFGVLCIVMFLVVVPIVLSLFHCMLSYFTGLAVLLKRFCRTMCRPADASARHR